MIKAKPKFNQAEKVISRFGGSTKLAALLGVSRVTIYRWMQPRPVGTDGVIPSSKVPLLIDAAREAGIDLTDVDWSPECNSSIEDMLS